MSIALDKRQLLVIVLLLLSLLITTLIIMHGALPGLWHQILNAKLVIISRYG